MNFEVEKIKLDKSIKQKVLDLYKPKKIKRGSLFYEPVQDNKLTYISVYQPTTTAIEPSGIYEDIRLGDMYTKFGVIGKKLEFVPMVMWYSRSFYDSNVKKNICWSPNGETPADMPTKINDTCKGCSAAKYVKGKTDRCKLSINILVTPTDLSFRPAVIQFNGKKFEVGKKIALQSNSFGDNLFDSTFTIETVRADGAAYYMFKITDVKETDEKLKPLLDPLQEFLAKEIEERIKKHVKVEDTNQSSEEVGGVTLEDID